MYNEDPAVREYIDERLKEINEKIYPILNGTDCTVKDYKEGIRREKKLRREIKEKDKEFYYDTFEI